MRNASAIRPSAVENRIDRDPTPEPLALGIFEACSTH
jgi:hypothetical protein